MDQPGNELALIVANHIPLANRNHRSYNEIFAISFVPMENSYIHIVDVAYRMSS